MKIVLRRLRCRNASRYRDRQLYVHPVVSSDRFGSSVVLRQRQGKGGTRLDRLCPAELHGAGAIRFPSWEAFNEQLEVCSALEQS